MCDDVRTQVLGFVVEETGRKLNLIRLVVLTPELDIAAKFEGRGEFRDGQWSHPRSGMGKLRTSRGWSSHSQGAGEAWSGEGAGWGHGGAGDWSGGAWAGDGAWSGEGGGW